MNRWERLARILVVVDRAGRIVGRKKLQKIVYLLQRLGAPMEERFDLHYFGPYSEELADEVTWLVGTRLLEQREESTAVQEYRTFSYELTPRGREAAGEAAGALDRQWLHVVDVLTARPPRFLELVATIEYLLEYGVDSGTISQRVSEIKAGQGFSSADVKEAMEFLKEMGRDVAVGPERPPRSAQPRAQS